MDLRESKAHGSRNGDAHALPRAALQRTEQEANTEFVLEFVFLFLLPYLPLLPP